MTLRLVGTCPVCEKQQKITPAGAMVHHGFRRPGWGSIVGDCFGVGYPAYELSSKGCEAYREMLFGYREGQVAWLAKLRSRPEKIEIESPVKRNKILVFHRDSADWQERNSYESNLRYKIDRTEYTIKDIDHSINRMNQRIESWQPAPLVEIDEEGLTPAKRQERTERKAERDAARAERDRKKQEHRAKVNERLARKAVTILFFQDEFERLAATPPSPERVAYANDLLFETQKKKYSLQWPYDLFWGPDYNGDHIAGPWGQKAEERAGYALVELGLAEVEHRTSRDYFRVRTIYSSRGNKIRVPEPDRPAEEILDQIAMLPKPS